MASTNKAFPAILLLSILFSLVQNLAFGHALSCLADIWSMGNADASLCQQTLGVQAETNSATISFTCH